MHLEPSARGRRAYDAGVNIVPYIDMLMTLMIFLMVTAVWTHTRALPAENTSGACTGPACGPGAERVVARLTASGIDVGDRRFAADDVERAVRALKGGGGLDVRVDDGVPVARVAALMDAAKAAGFTAQSLKPAAE